MFIMIDESVNDKVMTMAPKIIDKEAKKHETLSAAINVFIQKGVANTIMDDVAEVLTKSYIKGLKK